MGVGMNLLTSIQLIWHDATTNGTFTVETSNHEDPDFDSTDATVWTQEVLTITSPAASAADSFMVHLGNNGAKWVRVKFVATANSLISIWPHGKR
jgi:hypothetical protein